MKHVHKDSIFSIFKKELLTFASSPATYIVIVVFIVLWQFLFFRNAFIVGEATVRELFGLIPWLYMIFVPAITMGTIAQEKSAGTLEFVLTRPLTSLDMLIGKYLASLAVVSLTLLSTIPIAIGFSIYGQFDWGVYAGQLLGSVALASVFISIGICISAWVNNQIAALLLSVAASFTLVFIGSEYVTAAVPQFLGVIFEQLSVIPHFTSTIRGVLDLGDLWYYISFSLIGLGLAYLQLVQRQLGNRTAEIRRYSMGVGLLVILVFLTNIVGSRIPGRVDLTQERLFTLTQATQNTLKELDDVVNITVYRSAELPAQFQPTLREVQDILRDYTTTSNGNVVITYKDPSDGEIAQEAAAIGIQEVQFNVIGDEELQLKNGYLGLAVTYAGENEVIPFIQSTNDLEYQLTSFITKLTTTDKKNVGFLAGNGEKGIDGEYQILALELENQFELTTVVFDEENSEIPEDIEVLIVAGTTGELADAMMVSLNDFVASGRSILVLYDSYQANTQTLSAETNTSNLPMFFDNFGVSIEESIVYDLQSNETVSFGGGVFNVLLPYPFWIITQANEDSSVLSSRIDQVMLPWANPVKIDVSKANGLGWTITNLMTTTDAAGTQSDNLNLSPEQTFSQDGLQQIPLGLSLMKNSADNSGSRVIFVGDSDFLSNDYIQNSPQNLAFGIESISWLAQEQSLAEIQVKQRVERQLVFENPTQQSVIKYGSMMLATIVPLSIGFYVYQRRRMLRNQRYPA